MAKKKKPPVKESVLLAELNSRLSAPKFDITQFCFERQLVAVQDTADFSVWMTSRRSGKTLGCVSDLINEVHLRPGTVALYVTLSRSSAKRLIWPEALKINREFKLNGDPNIADLSLTFPNGSVVYFSGAKNTNDIEKFRGLPLVLAYIDEAQSFGSHLESLVEDVISKALYDYNGRLRIMGTPPPVPSGYFVDLWNSKNDSWSKHHWDMRDNPWLLKKSGKTPMQLIERDIKRKGVTIDDPSIQRECFGLLVMDLDSLIFKYNPDKNHFDTLPVVGHGQWHYVVGLDLGFDDADAAAVLAYHDHLPGVYLVEEVTRTKQSITDLAKMVEELIQKYSPHSIVLDAGGLGKKINEELNRRFNLPIKAAEKARKFEFISLLNDALRTDKFFADKRGPFALDTQKVELDREKSRDGKLVVSDRYHSDITDAVLYAYRECLHFLVEPAPEKIDRNTEAWYKHQKDEMEELALRAMEEKKRDNDDPGAISIDKVWKLEDNE